MIASARRSVKLQRATPRKLIDVWRTNPMPFITSVLKADPWSGAERVIRAVGRPHSRTVVPGAHAMAKSHSAALLILWGVSCGFKVITTASRFEQVKRNIWSEVHGLVNEMAIPLGVTVGATQIELSKSHFAVGWSTNNETRFQGAHGPFVLFIVDEAEGVLPGISTAIDGSRAGGDVRELWMGNPKTPAGPFFDNSRSPLWTVIHLSAFDTPNMADIRCTEAGIFGPGRVRELSEIPDDELNDGPRSYLAGPRWVKEMLVKYGPKSSIWSWKVLGQFPQQAEDALILLALIEAAGYRPCGDVSAMDIEVGIDVAGPGEDEHVIAARQGPKLIELHPLRGVDLATSEVQATDALADRTRSILRALPKKPSVVKVDEIGIGAYMCTILREAGFEVVGVNVARACETDADRERFANEKARIMWEMRERFEDGTITGIRDEDLKEQLGSISWSERGGRTQIESKADMRSRGLPSPDRAEAVMLAYASMPETLGVRSWLV